MADRDYDVRTRLLKQPTVASIGEHSSVIAYPGETNSKLAAYRNPPNVPQMYVWQRYLRPDDLFIDVGANIGIYTIFALDIGAHVVACEPDPHNYQRLTEHVRINGYSAELLNVALADGRSLRLTRVWTPTTTWCSTGARASRSRRARWTTSSETGTWTE